MEGTLHAVFFHLGAPPPLLELLSIAGQLLLNEAAPRFLDPASPADGLAEKAGSLGTASCLSGMHIKNINEP